MANPQTAARLPKLLKIHFRSAPIRRLALLIPTLLLLGICGVTAVWSPTVDATQVLTWQGGRPTIELFVYREAGGSWTVLEDPKQNALFDFHIAVELRETPVIVRARGVSMGDHSFRFIDPPVAVATERVAVLANYPFADNEKILRWSDTDPKLLDAMRRYLGKSPDPVSRLALDTINAPDHARSSPYWKGIRTLAVLYWWQYWPIPLGILLVLCAIQLHQLWRTAGRGKRGECWRCGYDRRRLNWEAKCPECGSAQLIPSPPPSPTCP